MKEAKDDILKGQTGLLKGNWTTRTRGEGHALLTTCLSSLWILGFGKIST